MQTALLAEPNVTGLPVAPPVAEMLNVPPSTKLTGLGGENPVMLCTLGPLVIVNDRDTCGAGL